MSFDEIFFVFVHVSLEDILNWAQQSLKCVSVDRNHSHISHCLNTCLSNCVLNQSDLSEIVSFLVFEYFLRLRSGCLLLFSNEFSFSDDIEEISIFTLVDNVAASSKLFLFQGITELLLLIGVNFRKDFHLRDDF